MRRGEPRHPSPSQFALPGDCLDRIVARASVTVKIAIPRLEEIGVLEEEPMRTHEVLRAIVIPRERLHYLEQEGYITPARTEVSEKQFGESAARTSPRCGRCGTIY